MITRLTQKFHEKEVYASLHPLLGGYFQHHFKGFTEPQLYSIVSVHRRDNILISAPTGTGKTLSAFAAVLSELMHLSDAKQLEDKVYAVYVSPLRALSNDIEKNLKEPLEEVQKAAAKLGKEYPIRIGVRTGDTPQNERAAMLKKPPHILITTPETLAIMLTAPKFSLAMKETRWIIVDEIHAIASGKRGTMLALSMESLQRLSPTITRIGLSATVAPLDEIANYLVGSESKNRSRACKVVDVSHIKEMDMKVLSPLPDLINTTQKKMDEAVYHLLDDLIGSHRSTLIFTNTRAATERVVHHLKEKFPSKYEGFIGAHHSSLSREHRLQVEDNLKTGKYKVCVSSTSLELGIDIGYIDLVILLGSPKGVARALQRCLPYESPILCTDGRYRKIGEIVENKLPIEVISYDQKKGLIKNKISRWHKNGPGELITISLECGETIACTKEHPVLTNNGWKEAGKINKSDCIAELRGEVKFNNKEPYLYELLPADKIFVQNKGNFFQTIVDEYRKKNKINAKKFSEEFGMPYSRFTDCRRVVGRKKSIRLDFFLKACKLCEIPEDTYLPKLSLLKTKGNKWPKWPLKLTKEMMWLAGIVATDGYLQKSQKGREAPYYKIRIGNKSKKMIDKVQKIARKYDANPYLALREDGIYEIEFGSAILAYIFNSFGIPYKDKSFEVSISNTIFSLPNDLIHAYLEGIFEGDGNLNIVPEGSRGIIRIFSASKKFVNGLHLLFSRLGYHNKVKKQKMKPSKLVPTVSDRDIYYMGIYRKEDLKRFFHSIPAYGEKALTGKNATEKWKGHSSLKKEFKPFIHYAKIEDITMQKSNEHVYNLTLENDPNNFIVGNIVVHNCGRAGHKLHDVVKGRIVVLDRDDLVECGVLLKNAIEKNIDRVHVPKNALDVLAQHIIGMVVNDPRSVEDVYTEITHAYPYESLSRSDYQQVLDYLSGVYAGLEVRHVYAKVWIDEKTGLMGKRGKMARMLYMTNVGTIPDEAKVKVKIGEHTVGTFDEAFMDRLRKGDRFTLGGNTLEFQFARGMTVQAKSSGGVPTIPSWVSEMLPLSYDLALEIQRFRKLMQEKFHAKKSKKEILSFIDSYLYVDKNAANAIYEYFHQQYQFAEIPHHGNILLEIVKEEGLNNFVFHTLFGRRVNDALSRAYAYALGRMIHQDVDILLGDNGFVLRFGSKASPEKLISLVHSWEFEKILEVALRSSEVLRRRFRHCATRAFMILRTYMGRVKSVGRQQMSSRLLLSAVQRIDENFPILREARREVLEDLMDMPHAKEIVTAIEQGMIKVHVKNLNTFSPFSFNLIAQGHYDLVKLEDRLSFIKRMHEKVMQHVNEADAPV